MKENYKLSIEFMSMSRDRLVLFGSLVCMVFFVYLVLLSEYEIHVVFINAVLELITIPFIIFLLLLTVLSVIGNIKNKFKIKSSYFVSFVLLMITFSVLTVATING